MALSGVFDNFIRLRPANGFTEFTAVELPVAASQTIATNDILSLSSGKLQQSIAAPSAGTSSLSGGNLPIAGIATDPITTDSNGNETAGGQTRTTTVIMLFNDNGNVLLRGATTNGAAQTLSNFTIGSKYQFGRFTNAANTASWYFLSPTTTNGEMVFIEIPTSQVGSTANYPNMWCKAALSATIRQLG